MKILVISRRAEAVRRAFQTWQMAALGLSFEFLDAVEAAELTDKECQREAANWPSPTRRQDIACFRSHRKAWHAVMSSGEKMLILEDDAVLSDDIARLLAHIEARADRWNSVYDLEFVPEPHIFDRKQAWMDRDSGFGATRVYQNRYGLAGYVIGPQAARRMLLETQSYALVNAYFWHRPWLAAYQIEPAPVIQKLFFDAAPEASFVRPKTDRMFRPLNKARKLVQRATLETIKARNLITGLLVGRTRAIVIDRSKFSIAALKSSGTPHRPEGERLDQPRESGVVPSPARIIEIITGNFGEQPSGVAINPPSSTPPGAICPGG